ncbi:MAG: KH domain-containing protein [Erysipelotrichaceae bacterium]|nr:KH domain-containing protein [Erysipelotrichaceae bacterium]
MPDLEKTLYDLCLPLVENKTSLSVKTMASSYDNEVLLYVYADNKDVARLIGRKGVIASALRQMISVASRKMHKRVNVKFEPY